MAKSKKASGEPHEARDDTGSSTVKKSKKGKKEKATSEKNGGSKNTKADSSDVGAEVVEKAAELVTRNPKKRKKSDGASEEATEVIDQPDEVRSAKEKRKKAKHSALGTAGNIIGGTLSAGLTTAAHGVNAVKDYEAEVAYGTEKSIKNDAAQVAKVVVESNDNVEGLVKKSLNGDCKSKKSSDGDSKSKKRVKGVEEDSKKAAATHPSADLNDNAAVEGHDGEEVEIQEKEHDQTLALLKGFDSGDEDQFSGEEIFKEGQSVPNIPKNSAKKLKAAKDESEEPGVVFVGYIYSTQIYIY